LKRRSAQKKKTKGHHSNLVTVESRTKQSMRMKKRQGMEMPLEFAASKEVNIGIYGQPHPFDGPGKSLQTHSCV